jgi:ribosome-binding factor A
MTRESSRHCDQVESVLSRAIHTVLARGIQDPRVRGMISVTGIRVSADVANATVLVSVLPAEHSALTMHGLRHAARYIRREVGELVDMRRVPVLSFKLDQTIKKEAAIIGAINRARPEGEPEAGEPALEENAAPIDDDSMLEDPRT